MTQQAPTPDEIPTAVAFLKKRGRDVVPIPSDKAGLYKIDGHICTGHDVLRYAVLTGWKAGINQGSALPQPGKR
ncbi:hypothetical protein CRT23_17020 [Methylobacterium sp. V23]|nr:hypothetical protein CRT23_17020 [Methylobacterium sp. V23]